MRRIVGPGTSERRWQQAHVLRGLQPFVLPSHGRVLVVGAHPDDEVLGAGGAIGLLHGAGVRVDVVTVTDGEASHPDSPTMNPAQLRESRAEELRAALAIVAPPEVSVERLAVPDGQVAAHEAQVRRVLADRLAGADLCLSVWPDDGHPDHEAVGRAAGAAAGDRGVRCAGFPVWMWHWANPADPDLPWARARVLTLPQPVEQAKRRAAYSFATQVAPLSPHPADAAVLSPLTLARLTRTFEVYFE